MELVRNFKRNLALVVIIAAACNAQKYPITLKHGSESYDGVVEVNVDKGEEIYKTAYLISEDGSEPKTGHDAPYTVLDANQKLDAMVDEANGVCYLSTYDANKEVSPVALKQVLESKELDLDETEEIVSETLKVTGKPIEDVTTISTVIGPHCADKTTYLTVPAGEAVAEKRRAIISRSRCRYIEITEYRYERRCSWLVICETVKVPYTKKILIC